MDTTLVFLPMDKYVLQHKPPFAVLEGLLINIKRYMFFKILIWLKLIYSFILDGIRKVIQVEMYTFIYFSYKHLVMNPSSFNFYIRHSMMGLNHKEQAGIVPRFCEDLFERLKSLPQVQHILLYCCIWNVRDLWRWFVVSCSERKLTKIYGCVFAGDFFGRNKLFWDIQWKNSRLVRLSQRKRWKKNTSEFRKLVFCVCPVNLLMYQMPL